MFKLAWRNVRRMSVGLLVVVPFLALGIVGTARAGIAGPKILTAQGGTTDSDADTGHIVMGGLVVLNNHGGAKSLDLTIAYLDNPSISGGTGDDFSCNVTNPSDLTYSHSKGIGTMTLTLSAQDTCTRTVDSSTFSDSGESISFNVYSHGSKMSMISTGGTLQDGAGDPIGAAAISGEMKPSGTGSPQTGGMRLISGGGGAVDSISQYNGHMALAGWINLTRVTKKVTTGRAKSLDLTVVAEDQDSNTLSCDFTDPADVAYTLHKGVGTLTLTVGPSDSCSIPNVGNSISFNLYAGGARGSIVTTGSTLQDSNGDDVIPAAVATFSKVGAF